MAERDTEQEKILVIRAITGDEYFGYYRQAAEDNGFILDILAKAGDHYIAEHPPVIVHDIGGVREIPGWTEDVEVPEGHVQFEVYCFDVLGSERLLDRCDSFMERFNQILQEHLSFKLPTF